MGTDKEIEEAEFLRIEKEKARDHKKVRDAKMAEWNGEEAPAERPLVLAKSRSELKTKSILIFKIKHEKVKKRTVRDDLRIAAKKSTHKRNRTPDDEYVLVGDRCNHHNLLLDDSSDDNETEMSEIIEICKKNAADLYDQEKRRQKKIEKRAEKEREQEREWEREQKAERRAKKEAKRAQAALEAGEVDDQVDLQLLF